MIHATVALFAFAVVICGLIIFRPFAGNDQITQDRLDTAFEDSADIAVEVTRSATPDISALAQAAVAAAPLIVNPGTGVVQAPPVALTLPAPVPMTPACRT
jgi:hypothetical protein